MTIVLSKSVKRLRNCFCACVIKLFFMLNEY